MRFLFSLPFLLIGLGTLYFGLGGAWRAHESNVWPVTQGRVITSKIKTSRSHNSRSDSYYADISYKYAVSGKPHTGTRIAYGDYGSGLISHAQSVVARYPVGAEVAVHYRPAQPDTALLEPGVKLQAFGLPLFGTIFLAAGIFLAKGSRRKLGHPPAPDAMTGPARE